MQEFQAVFARPPKAIFLEPTCIQDQEAVMTSRWDMRDFGALFGCCKERRQDSE